ncbi:hypothetical protein EJ03DRAFT_32766 [Teratosphaeria nubilosa]|uniref:Uncharacterized protein n=1 Tax=Teratosphaeria nubilosa TaxID=161662 RepID=A0A6G1KUR4_9PEZI|nr:hypothetical protein EJ03DRAFT_32766 [Teratosphaeria nubilosa]
MPITFHLPTIDQNRLHSSQLPSSGNLDFDGLHTVVSSTVRGARPAAASSVNECEYCEGSTLRLPTDSRLLSSKGRLGREHPARDSS